MSRPESSRRVMRSAASSRLSGVAAVSRRRRGSTLLVVVALLGMLSLLGVMFFTFAQQEEENAKNYHEAAKYIHDPELGPDVYFNWALEQLITGPPADNPNSRYPTNNRNSALYGGHLSLLPNAYGRDAHPHTGAGWGLAQTSTYDMSGQLLTLTAPLPDLDRDGVADSLTAGDQNQNGVPDVMEINRSPSAQVIIPDPSDTTKNFAYEFRPDAFPEPDVDYTYADQNNPFLAHIGRVLIVEDANGNGSLDGDERDYDGNGAVSAPQMVTVVKPSFFRPELLQRVEQDYNGNGTPDNEDANGDGEWDPATEDANGNGFADIEDLNRNGTFDTIARLDPTWYWRSWSRSLSLRPHPLHYFIPPIVPGQTPQPPTVRRYLNDKDPTDAAIIGALPGGSKGFPFNPRRDPNDQTKESGFKHGLWLGYQQNHQPAPGVTLGNSGHSFDVDADGDGSPEAILMDLAFPPQERPSDGALYVPIFGMTVYDLDALINLNAHGNLAGDTSPPTGMGATFGNGQALATSPLDARISRSLQGLSPYEVNPQWALDADPYIPGAVPGFTGDVNVSSATSDYAQYFGRNPFTNPNALLLNRWELANMEWWWFNKGRVEYGTAGSIPQVHAGRLGESNRVWNLLQQAGGLALIQANVAGTQHLFPFAGVFDQDDNRNANEGGVTNLTSGQTLAFQHPLSFTGRGRFTQTGQPKAVNLQQSLGVGNPMQWLTYDGVGVSGAVNWGQGIAALVPPAQQLLQNSLGGMLFLSYGPDGIPGNTDDYPVDDMDEITLDPRNLRRPYDEVFTYADLAALHLSKTDIDQTGTYSRLQDVMPGNINPGNATATANERRRRLTTQSWDRKQFSLPRVLSPGADSQPGAAGTDDNRNGITDDAGELGWPGTDDVRAWEFNVDLDGDNLYEFPPEFKGAPEAAAYYGFHERRPWGSMSSFTPLGTVCVDPFRPQLRRMLEVEYGNRDQLRLQFRLSVNQILDVTRGQNSVGHPYYSPLEFRPLTPHSTDSALTTITTVTAGSPLPAFPPAGESEREFWARYDRQRLCRDIYVMLYTLCSGGDAQNLATTAGSTVFTDPALLREMAQFAVNMVDSMDRDNVSTVFEYDTSLVNGWNLDDQPWTDDGSTDRQIVAGVEAQELTISESLWAFQEELANDNQYTPFDESNPPPAGGGTDGFHFVHVELRNVAPRTVNLADNTVSTGSGEDSVWRLRWADTDDPSDLTMIEDTTHSITSGNGIFFKANSGSVGPGGLYTVATSNWTSADSADLFVDYDSMVADMERISPRIATVGGGSASSPNSPSNLLPNTNLDLVHSQGTNQNRFHLAQGTTGDFLSGNYEPTAAGDTRAVLVLERRANPSLPQLPVEENPWIVVDYSDLRREEFVNDGGSAPTQSETLTALANITSWQRREALNATTEAVFETAVDSTRTNTIGGNNQFSSPLTKFDVWQMHPDRDFASVIELLSVSLHGPEYQTRAIARMNQSPYSQMHDNLGPFSAAAKFLLPSPPDQTVSGGPPSFPGKGKGPKQLPPGFGMRQRFRNMWSRLFGFVEVPTRTHRQLGDPLKITRVSGKLNINTMRHPEVLAGLLDDHEVFAPPERDVDGNGIVDDLNGDGRQGFGLPGLAADDINRDWWFNLLTSRDGLRPESYLTLPGSPAVSRQTGPGTYVRAGGSRPFRDLGFAGTNAAMPVEETLLRAHPVSGGPESNWTRRLFELGTEVESDNGTLHNMVRQRMLSKMSGNVTTRSNVFVVFIHVQFHEAYEDPATGAIRVAGPIDLNNDGKRDDGHRGFFIVDRSEAEDAYDVRRGQFSWRELVKHRLTIH